MKKTLIPKYELRSNTWLQEEMYNLWENYFEDVPRKNLVLVKFGRANKRQLGSIKWATPKTQIKSLMKIKENYELYQQQDDKRITVITINKEFKNTDIPKNIILATLAHEMCHYTHGFHSPLDQKYKYPHKGNIIKKEMYKRGLGSLYEESQTWLNKNWINYI